MAVNLYDRIKETCTATGTGNITLTGAVDASLADYSSRYADGESVPYCIVESVTAWEVGVGVYTLSGTIIARTAAGVSSSSNADGLVSFGGASKECFATITASDLTTLLSSVKTNAENIALLHFYRAIDNGLSVQNMVDGFVDEYQDETGVTPGYTADYDAAGNFYTNSFEGDSVTGLPVNAGNFATTSDETIPQGFCFSSDGLTLYVVGTGTGAKVHQYTLTTPWHILSGRTYDGNYSTAGQSSAPVFMAVSEDGSKMYVGSETNIYQYTLTTAGDITGTVTYNGSVAPVANMQDMFIKPGGSTLYVITDVYLNAAVEQYGITTAWDLTSGVSSVQASKDINAIQEEPKGMSFSDDGLVLFVGGTNSNLVSYIKLATAWALGSAFTELDTNIGTTCNHMQVSRNGLKLHSLQLSLDRITQYTLPDVWFMGPRWLATKAVPGLTAHGVSFSSDGLKMHVASQVLTDVVEQYTLTTPWDIATGVTSDGSYDVSAKQSQITDLCFSNDGFTMFIIGQGFDGVSQYTLTTAWDVTGTVTFDVDFSLAAYGTQFVGIAVSSDGLTLFCLDDSGNDINQFTLGSANDVTSPTYDGLYSVAGQSTTPASLAFSSDGKVLVITQTFRVYQYTLTTPWDVTGTVTYNASANLGKATSSMTGVFLSTDGSMALVCELADISSFELPTPYQALTIESISQPAVTDPDECLVLLLEEDIDAITLNTDLTVSVSRDGGTTYTSTVLENVGSSTGGKATLSGVADLSSQPAGLSLSYKITSSVAKSKIHGVSVQWS